MLALRCVLNRGQMYEMKLGGDVGPEQGSTEPR